MEPSAFEMSKKPRYSSSVSAGPTINKSHQHHQHHHQASPTVPSFENYGYGGSGPPQLPPTPMTPHHNFGALYSTQHPLQHTGMNAMTTPNSVQGATTAAPPSPYVSSPAMSLAGYGGMGMMNNMGGMGMGSMGGMNGMGMNGMNSMGGMGMNSFGMGMGGMNMFGGMNGMGGFGYSPQVATFQQAANTNAGSSNPSQVGQNPNQGANVQATASSPVVGNFGMGQNHYNPAIAAAGSFFSASQTLDTDRSSSSSSK